MIKAMETRPCEARAKEWELFCLEEAGESLQNPSAEMNHANPRQPRRSPHLQFSPGGGGGGARKDQQQLSGSVHLLRSGYLFPPVMVPAFRESPEEKSRNSPESITSAWRTWDLNSGSQSVFQQRMFFLVPFAREGAPS